MVAFEVSVEFVDGEAEGLPEVLCKVDGWCHFGLFAYLVWVAVLVDWSFVSGVSESVEPLVFLIEVFAVPAFAVFVEFFAESVGVVFAHHFWSCSSWGSGSSRSGCGGCFGSTRFFLSLLNRSRTTSNTDR